MTSTSTSTLPCRQHQSRLQLSGAAHSIHQVDRYSAGPPACVEKYVLPVPDPLRATSNLPKPASSSRWARSPGLLIGSFGSWQKSSSLVPIRGWLVCPLTQCRRCWKIGHPPHCQLPLYPASVMGHTSNHSISSAQHVPENWEMHASIHRSRKTSDEREQDYPFHR